MADITIAQVTILLILFTMGFVVLNNMYKGVINTFDGKGRSFPASISLPYFCIICSAFSYITLLPYVPERTVAIILTITVLLWVYAALKVYMSPPERSFGLAILNALALIAAALFFYKAKPATQITQLFTGLAALQIPLYIVAALFLRKKNTVVKPQSITAHEADAASMHQSKYNDKAYLREEQKLIVREKVATQRSSRVFQNKAEFTKSNFGSITGMEGLKERLGAAYKEMLQSVATNGADKRNGILLYGEPGNGKTFFAESLAGQIGWPIIKCTFGDVNSRWVGETTENVMQLFKDAIEQAPCVLFIDEIDALLVKRDQITQAESETGKTVNAILTKLVEVRDHQVLVVAATNYMDRLDSAAIREGRFDYKVEVPPPDLAARKGLLQNELRKHVPAATVDQDAIDRVALRWEGFSVSRIKAVAFEAAKLVKTEKRAIDFDCLAAALRSVQGSLGVRLPENTKSIAQMQFDDDVRVTLNGLAVRMRDIDEIERMGGSVPTGVLFYGPPGTGKTATVRALAKSSGWALLTTSGQDLSSSDSKIDEIYTMARNIRPCIVFIDEADDILANRQTSWNRSLTNKVLSVIDGAGGKSHDILWVAATNHPESIDSAALRGGRFTEKIEFRLPSVKVVEEFVRTWDEKNPAELDSLLTHERIASLLHGQAIANIEAIMQAAVNNMISRTSMSGDERVVMQGDIEAAYASVVG